MPALECAMDMLAEAAGIDPVELRLRNIPEKDPEKGIPFSSHTLADCLNQGAKAFGWEHGPRRPRRTREGEWWVGSGMASAACVHNVMEAKARVTLKADGTALVETDMTDIGTGTYTIAAQVVGEMLGLAPDLVLVDLGDTRHPRGPGSGGSWGAASIGAALYVACKAIREELAQRLGIAETELALRDGMTSSGTALAQLLRGEDIVRVGHYEPGAISVDYPASGFGAFFAQVRVNAFTGETRVDRMLGAIMVEERDACASPIQAKGIGELGMCGGAAAIGNAIYNTCGVRILDFPMTPVRVIAAMPD